MSFQTIGVIGAGAWGTALAINAQRAGRDVVLWAREDDVVEAINTTQKNPKYLPDADVVGIHATSDMAEISNCDAVMAVTPAQFMRGSLELLAKTAKPGVSVMLCSKGFETKSLKMMTDVLEESIPGAIASVLSGPSFAIDVALGLPTAVTLASSNQEEGERWMSAIGRPEFRPYYSDDILGAEAGGAVKNVLAIACGIVEGKGLGRSAHAALISRGFAELTRLGVAMGGNAETLKGLCGLGDLVLTCSSAQSRNMSFGFALGQGQTVAEVLGSRTAVTEGVATAPAIAQLAKNLNVEMPICETVAEIVAERITLSQGIEALLKRPFKAED
ncbi:NAD(P)H-dependent glycerol-3-phosphate dehydrogenase [Hirschia baltica]|uniref:Glycerol-3-phosphate dehydrogenase [NAD(P)+] n=1 Tax=Hirschia baltica (strain ATCC 49814 / DSM 5838 / IFAM 1418) TaxID=582402 RepID=C6XKH9_HIRBI|nr:NAD(P)H-dependent glycerol-3-phosphate dehydrogenase [Hirschia baltica]ACT57777.1 Glycerol-3-phosphate dehydrogenase (NAD(P)(+)) [Hirschia baltica ATCC 49814]